HENDLYKVQYEQLRETTKDKISADYKNHFLKIENKIREDSTYFWDFIKNQKTNSKRTVYEYHGEILTNPTEIANAFANHYKSVYNNDRSLYSIEFNENERPDELAIDEITQDDIISAISKLKRKKGPGVDNIPASIVKDVGQYLAVPLHHIFNLSIKNNEFPNLLKCTLIKPVPKKENSKQIADTRPIAKLNSFAKIFEIILYEKISTHIFPKISPHQHGFINNRSTTTNLLNFQTYCTEAIEKKSKQIDVFYGDIFKAYDQCHHDTLLKKLYEIGLSKSLVKFFASYLYKREHRVQHEKSLSQPFYPPSSIPQGSKLSGLKFIVMINGLQQVVKHSLFELYADDFKLYRTIDSADCTTKFQEDLNACQVWLIENKLKFHPSKCEIMTITNKKINTIDHTYLIENTPIPRITQKRDLGVIFQNNLKFDHHINKITSKCYQVLGFIQRNAKYFNQIETMLLLYSAYIRSKLDYACNVWSPTTKKMIKKVEDVQAKFVRYLFFKVNGFYPTYPEQISYGSLCDSLQLMTLENRRILFYLILVYKIFNAQVDVPNLRQKLSVRTHAVNLRNRNNFFQIALIKNSLHKKSPLIKAMELYNTYSQNLKFEMTIDQYRRSCEELLLTWK
ncbi:hypothetical protein WDU94_003644, partial [Cyamophila willieti]